MNLHHRRPKIYYNDNPRKAMQFHPEVLMLDEYDNKSIADNKTGLPKDLDSKNIKDSLSKNLDTRNIEDNPSEDLESKNIENSASKDLERKNIEDSPSKDSESKNIEDSLSKDSESKNIEDSLSEDLESKNIEGSPSKDSERKDIAGSPSKDLESRNIEEIQVETELISECISKTVAPNYLACSLVVDIPVIISQFKLKVDCQASVELDSFALEIKRTKKDVFLNECKLFPSVKKLFIAGFIRNNIEYSSINSEKDKNSNTIRHITTSIPFKCSTLIEYIAQPVINHNEAAIEIEPINEDLSGNDILEKIFVSSEHFNEKINCKLISTEVTELIIGEANNVIECEHAFERPFKTVTDKLAVNLVIKLIQHQQVMVNL